MASWALVVKVSLATCPLFNSLFIFRNCLFQWAEVNFVNTFNFYLFVFETYLEFTRSFWAEQITQLVNIDLEHVTLQLHLAVAELVWLRSFKYICDRAGSDSLVLRGSLHCEGLSRACLTICKDVCVVSVENWKNDILGSFVNLVLLRLLIENCVELHDLVLQPDLERVNGSHDLVLVEIFLRGFYSDEDTVASS